MNETLVLKALEEANNLFKEGNYKEAAFGCFLVKKTYGEAYPEINKMMDDMIKAALSSHKEQMNKHSL
jgi:hypothetical protein